MRFLLAFLMLAHGVAHLVGFAVAWRLADFPEMPYQTTLLSGRLDVGDIGIRLVGLAWVVLAVAFVGAATGLTLRQPWWSAVAWWTLGASILLCLVHWPEARIGLAVNGALVVLLYLAARAGALRGGV